MSGREMNKEMSMTLSVESWLRFFMGVDTMVARVFADVAGGRGSDLSEEEANDINSTLYDLNAMKKEVILQILDGGDEEEV